jgi:hypothetical protein
VHGYRGAYWRGYFAHPDVVYLHFFSDAGFSGDHLYDSGLLDEH